MTTHKEKSAAPDKPAFYVTTPIYYVNARPHLGHTYTTVAADTLARWKRMRGFDVHFLTGTDEHGQKIERSAAGAGKTPQQFVAEVSGEFRSLWDRMGLTYDDYIRTTEERHKRGTQHLFRELQKRGFIYKGTYSGQYCVFDELYVEGLPGTPCPDCGRITETVSEENYFFKLSAFERKLLEYYDEHPEFIRPETRRNEVIAFVRGGLRDLSISRTSFNWGIPVPGDKKHVIYVWMDALANYITALGYGSDNPAQLEKYWPADVHLIGKEISRFHCVYWPAFLMAADLPLPKSIVAHGWLLFEQSKMSKSRGNIVRAETVLEVLGADALRYFLLREIVFGQDGSFSFDALVQRYNADLANGYGNLVSRTLAMIGKYFDGVVPEGTGSHIFERFSDLPSLSPEVIVFGPDAAIQRRRDEIYASEPMAFQWAYQNGRSLDESVTEAFETLNFSRALEIIWWAVSAIDNFLTKHAPWKLAVIDEPEAKTTLAEVLYTAAESIRIITALVYPVIPDAAAKVWRQLGLGEIAKADLKDLQWGGLKPGTKLGELGPVFPRAEKEAIQRMQEMEEKRAAQTPAVAEDARVPAARSANSPSATPDSSAGPRPSTETHQPVPSRPASAIAPVQPAPISTASISTSASATGTASAPAAGKISIDDFAKVELRVAIVRVAERVPKADRLLRLEVDLGYEQRQIVAGIAGAYEPENLIGRKVVIVANLAPRKLRGLESNGMIVAASVGEQGKPVLAGFLEDVEIGARLK